ncbi:MAG TPA: hypothetical protein VMM76_25270 [Pirellulaceae bacterium]|nr:hypothetical protein [Pirellulaceae bacterium]
MQSATATFRNGRVELTESVDWPDGTRVEVTPLGAPDRRRLDVPPPMTRWPDGFFDGLRAQWGEEPFDRPPQGEFEVREDW